MDLRQRFSRQFSHRLALPFLPQLNKPRLNIAIRDVVV
ncbi:hypothetical protein BN1263140002 [Stenotrophomonas indicatrix]|nr:hypothetical protein BN1263140002 [Stenotrophomonas indicatrix]